MGTGRGSTEAPREAILWVKIFSVSKLVLRVEEWVKIGSQC